ncbi:hypothetical protein L0152_20945 [bacterium]|nr:hypothetical protein [bacterium]
MKERIWGIAHALLILNKVTVIDECGMGVLAEMNRSSIKFRASGMLLMFLLRSMQSKVA